jgi:hypothetical protein
MGMARVLVKAKQNKRHPHPPGSFFQNRMCSGIHLANQGATIIGSEIIVCTVKPETFWRRLNPQGLFGGIVPAN